MGENAGRIVQIAAIEGKGLYRLTYFAENLIKIINYYDSLCYKKAHDKLPI